MASIFLSHSSKDNPFARKLAHDLTVYGVTVWLDEAQMKVGDSLIQKIAEGIDCVNYVGAIISSNSVRSPWVTKELDIALNQEILGRRVKVLPILKEKINVPTYLLGKLYADFSNPQGYNNAFHGLLRRLGVHTNPGAHFVVYSDELQVGWENWSWDCRYNMRSTRYVYSGKYAISVELKGYGGLAFAFQSGLKTRAYSRLEFFIHGGPRGGQLLKVYINDRLGNGIRAPFSLKSVAPRTWECISIPLNKLDASDTTLCKINISNMMSDEQPVFYVDEIRLLSKRVKSS